MPPEVDNPTDPALLLRCEPVLGPRSRSRSRSRTLRSSAASSASRPIIMEAMAEDEGPGRGVLLPERLARPSSAVRRSDVPKLSGSPAKRRLKSNCGAIMGRNDEKNDDGESWTEAEAAEPLLPPPEAVAEEGPAGADELAGTTETVTSSGPKSCLLLLAPPRGAPGDVDRSSAPVSSR